ncbi:MAG: hypothetical protein IPK16_14710 [Anaerolineales bacterium]|nr:hypothetical protein [Anaerolineales bacterium]
MIGFISEIINETTEPLAVELWYRLTTKCYPESVLTYRTIEVPPGKKMFDHWGKISDCTGSARFTVEIRYHNEDYRGGRDLNVLH